MKPYCAPRHVAPCGETPHRAIPDRAMPATWTRQVNRDSDGMLEGSMKQARPAAAAVNKSMRTAGAKQHRDPTVASHFPVAEGPDLNSIFRQASLD